MATPRGDRDVSCSSVTDISESCGGESVFYRGHREGAVSWWGHRGSGRFLHLCWYLNSFRAPPPSLQVPPNPSQPHEGLMAVGLQRASRTTLGGAGEGVAEPDFRTCTLRTMGRGPPRQRERPVKRPEASKAAAGQGVRTQEGWSAMGTLAWKAMSQGGGSRPDTVPTLLSLALMQTWLCVYSLLNVCVRRRKHCRNSKHQSGVSWDQARPRAPPPTTQRPAQVPGTAGQGGSTFRPLRRWGKPGKPPKAGLGLGEDLLGGPQPQNGLGFGWSAPHRCRYSRADKPLLREEAVKGSQNPV